MSSSRCLMLQQILWVACLLATTNGFNPGSRINKHARSGNTIAPKCSPCALSLTSKSFNEFQANCRTDGLCGQRVIPNQLKLQHQRSPAVRVSRESSCKLMMTTTDSSNNVSNSSSNPFAKVWLWFKRLLAKIWSMLKRPFQSKDKHEGKTIEQVPPAKEAETEPVKEEVIITQMENLAAVEDETKNELSELLASAEVETKPEPSKPQSAAPVKAKATAVSSAAASSSPRQATACSTVDLSGNWTLIIDDAFKTQYDEYLRNLGQPMLVRTVALTVIGSTKEETKQLEGGQQLFIKGTNVRGSWERTLEASETSASADGDTTQHAVEGHVLKPMVTADEEEVEVASWWEENGTVHKSWVVGGQKYGGGDFENRRYLTDNGNILVCESIFHPNEEGREKAYVKWRFLKEGAMYGEEPAHFPNPFEVFEKKDEVPPVKKIATSKPGIVVGEIMDSVTTSDEVDMMSTSMGVEEYIDIEGWVPPVGERWAIAAPGVDLSGKWKLILTEQFKQDYDEFLKSLGQPTIVRGVAVLIVGNTREETKQTDWGRSLYIKGINAKGIWERTLTTSGSDFDTPMLPGPNGLYNHTQTSIVTADSERVLAESWWENDGRVHVSWTLGVKKYGGGSFESKRYLENNGDVYVCESTFHPDDTEGREKSHLTWKFLREGATIFVGK